MFEAKYINQFNREGKFHTIYKQYNSECLRGPDGIKRLLMTTEFENGNNFKNAGNSMWFSLRGKNDSNCTDICSDLWSFGMDGVGHQSIWMQVSKIIVRWLFPNNFSIFAPHTESCPNWDISGFLYWKSNHWNYLIILRLQKQLLLSLTFNFHSKSAIVRSKMIIIKGNVIEWTIVLFHNIHFSPFSDLFFHILYIWPQ